MDVGRPYAIRPAGMLALDMARIEAGLILIEVDYTSSKHALIPEQNYSPYELNLGRTWSPTLKQHIALASVDTAYDWPGSPLHVEWTVAARRGGAGAVVTPLPFFDPERKRA